MIHTLTRENRVSELAAAGSNVLAGRVNLDVLKKVVPPDRNCHFFVCGPGVSVFERAAAREKGVDPTPRFLESVLADLRTLGVERDRITQESYG